jgi:hypothetical protein
MRKINLFVLVALLLSACGSDEDERIIFDTVTADKVVKLSNEENSPSCAVHLQIRYATEENGHKAEVVNSFILDKLLNLKDLDMQQAVDSFANGYTSSYIHNFLPLYNQDRADESKRSWYEYHYIITSETQGGRQNTSVLIADIDYYEGGAHGINQRQILNFSNETGALLSLQDIFVPGYEERLTAVLLRSLCDKVGVEDIHELHENGYLFSMDMFPASNFLINDETITFYYNPYEIASFDKGSTELVLSLTELQDILRPEYMP